MGKDNEPAEAIIPVGDLIEHVHAAEPMERQCPGKDDYDSRLYLKVLKGIGYKGDISIEFEWHNIAEDFTNGVKVLKEQMADVVAWSFSLKCFYLFTLIDLRNRIAACWLAENASIEAVH